MVEARQMERIRIVGRVSVEPADVPGDMTAAQVANASKVRLENVLVVLEHNRAELEQRLSAKSEALDTHINAVKSQLTFAEQEPAFSVVLEAQGKEGVCFDGRHWKSLMPALVSDTFSDFIGEVATSVGLWRVAISADAENKAGAEPHSTGMEPGSKQNPGLRYALAGGLILAICAAVFFFWVA